MPENLHLSLSITAKLMLNTETLRCKARETILHNIPEINQFIYKDKYLMWYIRCSEHD
ncbi:hypothetical protein BABINDRAFT_130480 [Babjeviella inositovora NRRL Y-12698]|uniref:Uncharacterized protein n=1 Tax=Babjeviella inositovora NRRL Y-12698 TaxID=984486 RepID=A0A1E3QR88_9ASCO|nr:uncharacterized protein BABINDRAFT_130480 [Babjeviella inositovora NRRL Y-12698]ODQ80209.1 hypothetical protein BABINDRAFT_130480 [Babjeviella inositovora NRRL Y-12698]